MMPMNKKIFMAAIAICVLLCSLAFVLAVGVAKANPIATLYPHDPHTSVTVFSPGNFTKVSTTTITLLFSTDTSQWYPSYVFQYNPTYRCNVYPIDYYLDGELSGTAEAKNIGAQVQSYSLSISNISEGEHSVEIKVTTTGTHYAQVGAINGTPLWDLSNAPVTDTSGLVSFTVDIPPTISNLSVQNATYTSPQIPLNFTVDVPVSEMGYRLDNHLPIKVFDNTTISVPPGSHYIVVYAIDSTGNTAQSNVVFFTVSTPASTPTPTLTPTPTPTPTQTSSTTETPVPSPSVAELPNWIVLPLMAAAATMIVCFKKNKRS
jgi:hypothetical protein